MNNQLFVIWVIILFAIGAYNLIKGIIHFSHCRQIRKWDSTTATITKIFSGEQWFDIKDQIDPSNTIQLEYQYKYLTKSYTNNNLMSDKGPKIIGPKKYKLRYYKYNKGVFDQIRAHGKINIRVNPNNPVQSEVLLNDSRNMTQLLIGQMLIVWALGIALIANNWPDMQPVHEKIIVIEKNEILINQE